MAKQVTWSSCVALDTVSGKYLAVIGYNDDNGKFIECDKTTTVDTIPEAMTLGSALLKEKAEVLRSQGNKVKRTILSLNKK
jgi:hypothetical protein